MNSLPLWQPIAQSPPTLVIDTTIPWDWWFGSSPLGYGSKVIARMISTVVAVPAIWSIQLVERLLKLERAGRTTQTAVTRYISSFSRFEMLVDGETAARAWGDILSLARTHNLTPDNAAYLELSVRLNLPLATTDVRLSRAAKSAAVLTFTP